MSTLSTSPAAASPMAAGPAAARLELARASLSLREAITVAETPARYELARLSALRTATAVLAVRAHPVPPAPAGASGAGAAQRDVWSLLGELAPELAEWAQFFAAGASTWAAVKAGAPHAVTERAADDLVRDAERFLAVVEGGLR